MQDIQETLAKAREEFGRLVTAWQTSGLLPGFMAPPRVWLLIGAVVVVIASAGVAKWWMKDAGPRHASALYHDGVRLLERGATEQGRAKLEKLVTAYPLSDWADDALLALGRSQQATREIEEAKINYQGLLALYPDSPLANDAKQELKALASERTFVAAKPKPAQSVSPAQTVVGAESSSGGTVYEVRPGDTLGKIAKRFGTTVEDIQQANGLTDTLIRRNQRPTIPVRTSSAAEAPSSTGL